jgi:hypothetical protein
MAAYLQKYFGVLIKKMAFNLCVNFDASLKIFNISYGVGKKIALKTLKQFNSKDSLRRKEANK